MKSEPVPLFTSTDFLPLADFTFTVTYTKHEGKAPYILTSVLGWRRGSA
jgi:hypothetical protein